MAAGEQQGALATAAVAAAAGAAVYGLRKALAQGGGGSGRSHDDDHDDERESRGSSVLDTAWESASHTLLPLAEDAADAAGKWVAENAPEVVRDRIMPRFVEAFTDAA